MYFDDILSKTFNQDKIAADIELGTTATYVYAAYGDSNQKRQLCMYTVYTQNICFIESQDG